MTTDEAHAHDAAGVALGVLQSTAEELKVEYSKQLGVHRSVAYPFTSAAANAPSRDRLQRIRQPPSFPNSVMAGARPDSGDGAGAVAAAGHLPVPPISIGSQCEQEQSQAIQSALARMGNHKGRLNELQQQGVVHAFNNSFFKTKK